MRSLLAFWIGGASSAPSAPVDQAGYRGMMSFWSGGSSAGQTVIPPVVVEQPSGGWFPYVKRVRFKFKDEEEREAAEILLEIVEKAVTDDRKTIETKRDVELALRIRLNAERMEFHQNYLNWISQAIEAIQAEQVRRRRNKAVAILLLH